MSEAEIDADHGREPAPHPDDRVGRAGRRASRRRVGRHAGVRRRPSRAVVRRTPLARAGHRAPWSAARRWPAPAIAPWSSTPRTRHGTGLGGPARRFRGAGVNTAAASPGFVVPRPTGAPSGGLQRPGSGVVVVHQTTPGHGSPGHGSRGSAAPRRPPPPPRRAARSRDRPPRRPATVRASGLDQRRVHGQLHVALERGRDRAAVLGGGSQLGELGLRRCPGPRRGP